MNKQDVVKYLRIELASIEEELADLDIELDSAENDDNEEEISIIQDEIDRLEQTANALDRIIIYFTES